MTARTTSTRATTPRRQETPAGATTGKDTATMTHPGYPHPDYDRPADTRPCRDLLDTRVGRAVLGVLMLYVTIAFPIILLRCIWQLSPLAAIASAAAAVALYAYTRKAN